VGLWRPEPFPSIHPRSTGVLSDRSGKGCVAVQQNLSRVGAAVAVLKRRSHDRYTSWCSKNRSCSGELKSFWLAFGWFAGGRGTAQRVFSEAHAFSVHNCLGRNDAQLINTTNEKCTNKKGITLKSIECEREEKREGSDRETRTKCTS
jgi:hypothetical protein